MDRQKGTWTGTWRMREGGERERDRELMKEGGYVSDVVMWSVWRKEENHNNLLILELYYTIQVLILWEEPDVWKRLTSRIYILFGSLATEDVFGFVREWK